jgi:LPXTG-site transpeptidase (sortase) family protein
MPGEAGNVELAAHRDTFFRGLRNIKKGDLVTLSTVSGPSYEYRVDSLAVVSPGSTDVLASFPGPGVNLITCYPFTYVGAAPERFVVHAVEVRQSASVIKNVGMNRKRKSRHTQTPRLAEVSTTLSVVPLSGRDTRGHSKGHFLHLSGIRTLLRKIVGGDGNAKPSATPEVSKGT